MSYWRDLTTFTAAHQLEYTHLVPVNMFLLVSVFFLPAVLVHCAVKEAQLFITAPKSLEAVTGSCLMIPCSFRPDLDNTRTIVAVWIKDDSNFKDHPDRIVFNSSNAVNYPYISIIGDLKERNCTTKFNRYKLLNTIKFFFRIENESFKATAISDPVLIKLKDSPPRPTLEVSGDLKDLKEKESVTITCSALTPCPHSPPQLTWSLQQDAHSQTEQNTEGTFSTQIQKTIILSDTHDGLKISCSAVYPVDGGEAVKTPETELTLSVSYAPKDTTASISPSGSSVNLTCSSRAKPAVSSFTWFKNSDHGAIIVSEGDFYSFNVADITDPASFYCVAENALGNQTSSWIHVNKTGSLDPLVIIISVSIGFVFICLVFSVWWLKKHRRPQQTQTQTAEEFSSRLAADEAEKDVSSNEGLQYEHVSFSKRRDEAWTVSAQNTRQQEETLYTQVKVHKPESHSSQVADVPEDLYAKVKRK